MATEVEQSSSLGENGGGEECGVLEQAVIERRNLLNIVKLTVKVLIESTMRTGRPLDDTDTHLQQLFAALEHSLRHRLKGKEMSYALTQTSYVDNIKHECKYVNMHMYYESGVAVHGSRKVRIPNLFDCKISAEEEMILFVIITLLSPLTFISIASFMFCRVVYS